ncbi:MAG: rhodanese-like domain-containing protein [Phycisphaerales bacterium]|jgi:rhodanese-related sulfurtransferase|nr:rhodanese-like domain-containing protein [Phycisphaerales bacterium]MDP6891135.1 rhodanese-like domain-containing protein [Phycisphaerales bacterium]
MSHFLPLRFALITGLALLAAGCSKSYSDKDVHWLSIEDAKTAVDTGSSSWFSESRSNAWIDPRDVVFYRVGHIPGAINVQLSNPNAMSQLDGYGMLIVYGGGYEAPLADAMIKMLLKEELVEEVKGLRVGFDGWREAGQPVERGEDPRQSAATTGGDRWQRQPVDDE